MLPQALLLKRHVNSYQQQEINTLSPGLLIEKLYNMGIRGCMDEDSVKVSRVLTELISALDFSFKEIALGLYKLYEYCLRKVKAQKFQEVSKILKELAASWKTALTNMGSV